VIDNLTTTTTLLSEIQKLNNLLHSENESDVQSDIVYEDASCLNEGMNLLNAAVFHSLFVQQKKRRKFLLPKILKTY